MAATRSRAVGCAACGLALAASAAVAAQPADPTAVRDAARQLARDGVRKYDAGDSEGARQLFQQAYRLYPAPTIAVREARALANLSRLVEAAEAYVRATNTPVDPASPDAFQQAVAEARVELEALRPRIPRILITVEGVEKVGAGLSVRLDGVAVPPSVLGVERAIDPGMHKVDAWVDGGVGATGELVSLREGDVRTVVLRLDPRPTGYSAAPPPAPSPGGDGGGNAMRTAGWIAVAAGGAGVALGVTAGLLSLSRKSDLDGVCENARCPESAQDDLDAFRTLRTVSTIGYVAGALGAGVGVTLLLTSPDAPPRHGATVSPWLGAGSAGVRGTFQ